MSFTKTQLQVFNEIINNNNRLFSIYQVLKKNKTHVSEILSYLIKKKLIIKKNQKFFVSDYSFSIKLNFLLTKAPKLIDVLKDHGIELLLLFFESLTVKKASEKSNLKEITIYKFIKKARNFSILCKNKNKYFFNEKIWPDLKFFLLDYKDFNNIFDERVPIGSVIYYKNKKEIIFSYEKELEWASPTAFTIFKNYGLLIYSNVGYYYLPKIKLTKKDILLHTLKIIEKTKDFREILYLALFYYKYKKEFKNIKHEILDNLNKIYNGEKIERYPPLKEIKEKAEMYYIKM
jgi:hypothetical protein